MQNLQLISMPVASLDSNLKLDRRGLRNTIKEEFRSVDCRRVQGFYKNAKREKRAVF